MDPDVFLPEQPAGWYIDEGNEDLNVWRAEFSGRSSDFDKGKASGTMFSALRRVATWRRTSLIGGCLALLIATQLAGAGKSPMKVLKFDPAAEKVELFTALETGAVSVRVVAHDVKGGNLFIENQSGKPLTIDLPEAMTAVHVLKQVGQQGFFNQAGNGLNGNNQFGQQGGGQQGGGQSLGIGFGQQQGNTPGIGNANGVGQNPGGNGFFSIPPERVVQIPYQSVCLNYGKPDPSPRMTYRPMRVEEYTQDKVLQEVLLAFGKGRMDHTAAQAAAWHLTDKLSWKQLASLKEYTLPGVYTSQVPIFTTVQLQAAQELVTTATKRAEDRAKSEPQTKPTTTGTSRQATIAAGAGKQG